MKTLLEGRCILVVADEMTILMLIEGMLADPGRTDVVAAATVAQGVTRIEAGTFDAAMLDIDLNGDDSYPVAEALDACATPSLFRAATSIRDVRADYRGHPFPREPFMPKRLRDTVEALFAA